MAFITLANAITNSLNHINCHVNLLVGRLPAERVLEDRALRRMEDRFIKAALVVLSMLLVTNLHAAPPRQADPFAGDTWHAMEGSWPGSIKFDGKEKKVVLEPLGSEPIHASYAYTLKPVPNAKRSDKKAVSAVVEGKLTMTTADGQVSQSDFQMENAKILTLTFAAGQKPERYQRMTKAEEQAEIEKIKAMAASGKLKMPSLPATIQ